MSLEARLLVLLLRTMFIILVELNWSPSMMADILAKRDEFGKILSAYSDRS